MTYGRMGLGSYPAISLAEARELAGDKAKQARAGIDPIDQRRMDRASNAKQTALSITFAECAEQYIRQNSPGWKNPKHVALWRTSLRDYAFPVIGTIGEVTN